jgi:hypothetical protein
MTKEIPLPNGLVALVDDEDHAYLSQFNWHVQKNGKYQYVVRMVSDNGRPRLIIMSRVITQAPADLVVHYRNRNTLDLRRENLVVVPARSVFKYRPPTSGSSQYRGVYWSKDKDRWRGMIRMNGRKIHLGYFQDEAAAARAYDQAAHQYFGEEAELNFPEERLSQNP